jgi:hypothetical protein
MLVHDEMTSPGLFSSYHIKFALNISLSIMLSEQQNPHKKGTKHHLVWMKKTHADLHPASLPI